MEAALPGHQDNSGRVREGVAGRDRRNPATAYLQTTTANSVAELVNGYARYLLSQTGINAIPIDLERVLTRFSISRRFVGLPGQRALTTPDLAILVEEGDLHTVQVFSTAHELMEFLYLALDEGHGSQLPDELINELCDRKEQWCERGAAELVMPTHMVLSEVQGLESGLDAGRYLARRCGVSLTAALRKLLEVKQVPGAVVVWRNGHSSGQFVPSKVGQGNLFGDPTFMDPPKKLRIGRVFPSPGLGIFIPAEKSVGEDTHEPIPKC
jgi:hypothetical protein